MLDKVEGIANDTAVEPRTRLAAAKDWLDRAGVRENEEGAAQQVEVVIRWPDRA